MIYFFVMSRIARTLVIFILLGVTGFSVWAFINMDRGLSLVKEHIRSEFAEVSGQELNIEKARLALPGSLVLQNLTITCPEEISSPSSIRTIKISPDFLSTVKNMSVTWKIQVRGLLSDDVSADILFKTISRRCQKWEDIFDPLLVDEIILLDGAVSFKGIEIRSVKGDLELFDTIISRGEISFEWKDIPVSGYFSEIPGSGGAYRGTMASEDIYFSGAISPDKDSLEIKQLRGIILSLGVDLQGMIFGLNSKNRTYELKGRMRGDIEDLFSALHKSRPELLPFSFLPSRHSQNKGIARGSFFSRFDLLASTHDINNLSLDADISSSQILFGDIPAQDIMINLSASGGKLKVFDTSFAIMDGKNELDISMDIVDDIIPIRIDIATKSLDLNTAINSFSEKKQNIHGKVDLNLSFSGSGRNLSALIQNISTGNVVSGGECILEEMSLSLTSEIDDLIIDRVHLDNIRTEISLERGILELLSLQGRSFGGSFQSYAHLDLIDPFFPFVLKSGLKNINTSEFPSETINSDPFGRANGTLDLDIKISGSGKDLPGFLNSPGEHFMKLIETKKISDTSLEMFLRLDEISLLDNILQNISLSLSLSRGILDLSSLNFDIFQGRSMSKGTLDLIDSNLDLSFDSKAEKITLANFLTHIPAVSTPEDSSINWDISIKVPGRKTWDILKHHQDPGELLTGLLEIYRDPHLLSNIELFAFLETDEIIVRDVKIDDIHLILSAESGKLNISSLGFDCYGGSFLWKGEVDLINKMYPFNIEARARETDLGALYSTLFNKEQSTSLMSDLTFTYKGYGRYLSDVYSELKKISLSDEASSKDRTVWLLRALSKSPDFVDQEVIGQIFLKTTGKKYPVVDSAALSFSLDSGVFSLPFSSFSIYRGKGSADLELDLKTRAFPFELNAKVEKADLEYIFRSGIDPENKGYGDLDLNLKMRGTLADDSSFKGFGDMSISRADLGPMPIIAPLLGGIYEALQKVFPVFRKTAITSAEATFTISDRKVSTKDLVFRGEDMWIVSEGYVDFDGNLDLSFVNELILPEEYEEEHWAVSIRNFITSFGRSVSRARLKGTLENQKWQFDYLTPISSNIGKNLRAFFHGLTQ